MAVFAPARADGGRSGEYQGGWTWLLAAGILTSMICGWAYGEREFSCPECKWSACAGLQTQLLMQRTAWVPEPLGATAAGRCSQSGACAMAPCVAHSIPSALTCRLGSGRYRRHNWDEGAGHDRLDPAGRSDGTRTQLVA